MSVPTGGSTWPRLPISERRLAASSRWRWRIRRAAQAERVRLIVRRAIDRRP